MNQSSRQRERRCSHDLLVGGKGGSVMRCTPPFLGKATGGLALSQTDRKRSYLTKGPMGIIPSGMIPHWESTATSNQHIQVRSSRKGFRAKRGIMGAAFWH